MAYKTFLRSAQDWDEFGSAQKTTANRGLTYDQARRQCKEYNRNRTPEQRRKGTKLEFTAE